MSVTLAPANPDRQRTLARPATFQGAGLFAGRPAAVRLLPAAEDQGRTFVRTDLPGRPRIPALAECRVAKPRRTALRGQSGAEVEMTEHVLSALAGLGIDNCDIEIDAAELPALDGSALPIVQAILAAGTETQNAPRRPLAIAAELCVRGPHGEVAARPGLAGALTLEYELDYPAGAGLGRQTLALRLDPETYLREIAAARTFVTAAEAAALRAQGIGTAMSPRNVLVFNPDGSVVDNELRYPDEAVRHKLLDLVGDLALVGRPLEGRIAARRSGHAEHTALAQALAGQSAALAA